MINVNKSFPHPKVYNVLYNRYILNGTQPNEFISKTCTPMTKVLVDLCTGDGQIADISASQGIKTYAVDVSGDAYLYFLGKGKLDRIFDVASVEHWIEMRKKLYKDELFDAITCRQGINYWFSKKTIEGIYDLMNVGAKFMFNTFIHKPTTTPMIKQYTMNVDGVNRQYIEVSWSIKDIVQHVQICEGYESHVTSFKYISDEMIQNVAAGRFNVELTKTNKTAVYVLTKV